jgi:hypothetical protein
MLFTPCTSKLRKILTVLVLTSLINILFCFPVAAFDRYNEYEVKAAFLYNLTNFIDWPAQSYATANSPFQIVILGENPFGSSLEKITRGEHVDGHPIQVTIIADIAEFSFAHLLFISTDQKANIDKIMPLTRQLGLLSVSDFNGFNDVGGGISLITKNKRLELYLSDNVLEINGLKCSSKLLRLATIVKGALQ